MVMRVGMTLFYRSDDGWAGDFTNTDRSQARLNFSIT